MFRSMCRHDGPMTMAVEIASVASQCCPPAIFSLLRSSVPAASPIRCCRACSISRCRHFVRRAVSWSRAAGCVRHAGPNCRSLRDPIASGWARPSSMTPDRASCRWRRLPTLRPIIALAQRFDEISRALVHALKYGDRLDLAPMMGHWISRAGHELLGEADALVPVPLHWRRLWARRFNQSAGRGSIAANRRAGRCRRTQAGQADRAAGWAVADRTRRQCPRRVSCARRRQVRRDRTTPSSHR